MPNDVLAMDVRGTAFCRLINIYKVGDPSDEGILVEGERRERGCCTSLSGGLLGRALM